MQLVVLTDELLAQELLINGTNGHVQIKVVTGVEELMEEKNADGFIDLLFEYSEQRIKALKTLLPKPVIVNSVAFTLQKINESFIRINAWPGFLKRQIVEASVIDLRMAEQAVKMLSSLNKSIEWVEDRPGFITARVIAMIINEAWFALEEGVSTKEEIDIAMKLGTNYPYGPFDWCDKIGIKNIYNLLDELSKGNLRYKPAALLLKEASI